jgi:hypothetical protein
MESTRTIRNHVSFCFAFGFRTAVVGLTEIQSQLLAHFPFISSLLSGTPTRPATKLRLCVMVELAAALRQKADI